MFLIIHTLAISKRDSFSSWNPTNETSNVRFLKHSVYDVLLLDFSY